MLGLKVNDWRLLSVPPARGPLRPFDAPVEVEVDPPVGHGDEGPATVTELGGGSHGGPQPVPGFSRDAAAPRTRGPVWADAGPGT